MKPDFRKTIPEGDTRERSVCVTCGFIDYENPKIVAGAVVVAANGQLLLCRRGIEPRKNFWTLPAGFLENHEPPEEGAIREVREEACADITLDGFIGMFTVRRLSQVQIFFRAHFTAAETFAAGDETLEARLFAPADIPWPELSFPSVTWAIQRWQSGALIPLNGLSTHV